MVELMAPIGGETRLGNRGSAKEGLPNVQPSIPKGGKHYLSGVSLIGSDYARANIFLFFANRCCWGAYTVYTSRRSAACCGRITFLVFGAITMSLSWPEIETVIRYAIDNVLLYGPPATGKTYNACRVLRDAGYAPVIFGAHEETTASSLEGCDTLVEGSFRWRDGKGIRAWRANQPLVVDEIDKLSGDALSFALTLLNGDTAKYGHLLPTGETVVPGERFRCVATSNITSPTELSPALRSRFPLAIYVQTIHPQALSALPGPLRQPAADIIEREMREESGTLDVRAFLALSRLARHKEVGKDLAIRTIFGERAEAFSEAIALLDSVLA